MWHPRDNFQDPFPVEIANIITFQKTVAQLFANNSLLPNMTVEAGIAGLVTPAQNSVKLGRSF